MLLAAAGESTSVRSGRAGALPDRLQSVAKRCQNARKVGSGSRGRSRRRSLNRTPGGRRAVRTARNAVGGAAERPADCGGSDARIAAVGLRIGPAADAARRREVQQLARQHGPTIVARRLCKNRRSTRRRNSRRARAGAWVICRTATFRVAEETRVEPSSSFGQTCRSICSATRSPAMTIERAWSSRPNSSGGIRRRLGSSVGQRS